MPKSSFLIRFFARWIVTTLAIFGVAWLLPKGIQVQDFQNAILAGLALGLINTFVRPLIVILTLPLTVVTLGVFLLVINALMLLLVGELVPGFEVEGFGWAFLASILISMVGALLHGLVRD